MNNRSERWDVVCSAVDALSSSGAHAWRTHLQKLLFFADEWNALPSKPYDFVIHRFGPYSFDLDRDIADMQGFGVLNRESLYRLGASYSTSNDGPFASQLKPLAEWLGKKSVQELEVLATTEFVRNRHGDSVAEEVRRLKPHVSPQDVQNALRELDSEAPKVKEQIAAAG